MFTAVRPRCLHAVESRAFSTSAPLAWKSHKNALAEAHADLPPYPPGPARWYKQSDKGLYGGARIRFGNNVSEKTETKSRRSWHPNILRKSLFSKALNKPIKLRVSSRVLRTIDKVGGLDEYLLGEKSARIKELGMEGWRLRCLVMGTRTVRLRFNAQRRELGLPEVDYYNWNQAAIEVPSELMGVKDDSNSEFAVEAGQDLEADQDVEGFVAADGNVMEVLEPSEGSFERRVEEAKRVHTS